LTLTLFFGALVRGAQDDRREPSAQPAPMLERMSRETQALYEFVRPGLVRVELPPPKWMLALGEQDNPLNRWPLDAKVREALQAEQGKVSAGQVKTSISPSTQGANPATQPGEQTRWQRTLVQRPDGGFELVAPESAPDDGIIGAITAPRSLGVVYDDRGHIVLPVYVDKESVDEQRPLTVIGMDGGASAARFVGSDRQTNLTVLKLEKPLGRVVPFAGAKPTDGALVMMLAQGGDGGRLAVWARGQQDRGIAVSVEGNVTGFARYGQFLGADLARPVIDQLISHGTVRRARLGVLVTESEAPDGRRAMHVDQVKPGSAAEAGGLRTGDYIFSVAGAAVDDLPNFAAIISSRQGPTAVQVLRNGQVVELKVDLRQK
jgi:hypothetical protein